MKNIIKNVDDLYYNINVVDNTGQPLVISADSSANDDSVLHTFIMQFFTQNNGDYVEYDSSDLVDNVLRVSASHLSQLADGPLRVRFILGLPDSNYDDDLEYTVTQERLTGYFLKTVRTKQTPQEEPVDSSINENDTEGGQS